MPQRAENRAHPSLDGERFDAVVIGGGFGGLAAALHLVEAGARTLLVERLGYVGGCAATFTRQGHQFEAGATLFPGFDETSLLGRWVERHHLPVTVEFPDPAITFRTPHFTIDVHRDRDRFTEAWCRLPDAPVAALRRYFRLQERLARPLWSILEAPELLPPWTPRSFAALVPRAFPCLPLLPWRGRPLSDLLDHCGLSRFEPLRQYLDSACQITVQCGVASADIPAAVGAIDAFHRGAGHVRGGIGTFARAVADRITALGGTVALACAAKGLGRDHGRWRVETRRGTVTAEAVLANVLPSTLATWVEEGGSDRERVSAIRASSIGARLASLDAPLDDAWGACMLYRAIDAEGLDPAPHHLQLRARGAGEATEGDHVFCSISGESDGARTPNAGERTVTCSTHVSMRRWREHSADRGAWIASIQERMRRTIASLAPDLAARTTREWTASPRTFERFTGRPNGCVGGVPRRAGLDLVRSLTGGRVAPGLFLVGDSVFPGQSVLATAIGGTRTAVAALRDLSSRE